MGTAGTECMWYGISCNESSSTVIDISLWSNNLVGTIPSSIGNLPNLEGLALAGNDLSGPIPSSIGNLTRLTTLNLQENQLSGPIPSSIGNLSSLVEMHLFENQLSGPIPASIGQLTALEMFTLAANPLTGTLPPELGNLSSMIYLDLGGLHLSGSIPASIGQLSNLEYLSIEESGLSGSIPPELGQLFNLKTLHLSYNMLSGPIPKQLAGMTSIEELYLGINELTGTIPEELMSLTSLVSLTLDGNQLTGSIPTSIGNLSNLQYLSLGYNQLSGTIPVELGQLENLFYLDMPANRFSGTIPPELGNAKALNYIDFSGNQDDETGEGGLTGTVPVELSGLPNLQSLELSNNDLSGPIPPELGSLSNLQWLGLAENRMTGPIPGTFANLSKLRWLSLYGNHFEGTIPTWLGQLTDLDGVLLGGNLLTGTIPANLTNLTKLQTFDICGNFIRGPIPSDIEKLSNLEYLTLCENDLTGPIPDGFWTLEELIEIRLESNQLSGSLPAQVGNLVNADVLLLDGNQLEGEIPAEIGELSSVTVLNLDGNRFSGSIPPEIGQLTQLQFLGLEKNALRGEIPVELGNLVNLEFQGLRLSYNSLFTNDSSLASFINAIHDGEPFENSQTVPPANVSVSEVTDRSAIVSWTPILYIYDEGGYEVTASPVGGGASVVATTPSKEITSIILRGLSASTSYNLTVRSTTHPHGYQQNFIRSAPSASVSFTTGPKVTSPASVGLVSLPGGLIQIGGVPQNTTSYTLANFGDVSTEITLGQDGDFFTQIPASFTLEPGASRIVTVESVPNRPPDSYWGTAFPVGTGVSEDLFITIQLLSIDTPSGQAIAEAETSRVELSGSINEDAIGTVTFRNVGTATLTGILVSDVDWIETPTDLISIGVDEVANVNFTVRRSKRPDAGLGGSGTLFGSIRLIYLDGGTSSSLASFTPSNGTTGVSQTLVTVVDTSKPPVTPSEIPPLEPGEVMHVIPGVSSGNKTVSDVFITNSFGSTNLTDLRVYFKPLGGGASSVAQPGSVAPTQSLAFASVVDSVFESESSSGSLLVRSANADTLLVSATRSNASRPSQRFAGSIPIFRSDRAVGAGGSLHLPGVRSSGGWTTTLFVQEVTGGEASATVDALSQSGSLLAQLSTGTIGSFGLVERTQIPEGAATLVVTPSEESTGRIVAWALIEDTATGDGFAVVDWSRYYAVESGESRRIPLAIREGEAPGRKRPVRRRGTGSSRWNAEGSAVRTTELAMFNPDTAPSSVRLTYWASGVQSEKTLTLDGKETRIIDDAVTFIRGGSGSSTGYVIVSPVRGQVATSARITGPAPGGGRLGSSIPVLGSSSGLRLGQARGFAGLEDSTQATVLAGLGGTARTSFGIAEVSGSSVTVRATLRGVGGGIVAGANIFRDFTVDPRSVVLFDDMARTILGAQRENLLGDLRNLQLELRVVDGNGAATVLVISTDNGSTDPTLRLE